MLYIIYHVWLQTKEVLPEKLHLCSCLPWMALRVFSRGHWKVVDAKDTNVCCCSSKETDLTRCHSAFSLKVDVSASPLYTAPPLPSFIVRFTCARCHMLGKYRLPGSHGWSKCQTWGRISAHQRETRSCPPIHGISTLFWTTPGTQNQYFFYYPLHHIKIEKI